MIELYVTNPKLNPNGWKCQFKDQDSLNIWLNNQIAVGSFGLPQQQVKDSTGRTILSTVVVTDSAEVPEVAAVTHIETIQNSDGSTTTNTVIDTPAIPAIPAVTHNEYIVAAEYTVTQTNVSAQAAQQQALSDALSRQNVGASIIASIFLINEGKLKAGTLTTADLINLMQDSSISMIRELLWAGSLTTAKSLITSYSGPYFTAEDKASILNLLVNY